MIRVDINVGDIVKKINISGQVKLHEPMSRHTSFKIGGPADIYTVPADEADIVLIAGVAQSEGVPLFVLGDGANILVSDKGIRGIVLDMSQFAAIQVKGQQLHCGAGAEISDAAEIAAQHALSGLEFIYKMPGSVGGALWMNARCYGQSISEVPGTVHYLDDMLDHQDLTLPDPRFAYKKSPFQGSRAVLLSLDLSLQTADQTAIWSRMQEVRDDRRRKGHFEYPSAGSVFKNNRNFGMPSGQILDELGLRGLRRGGAQIAPFHANIIINNGTASAEDVRDLILHAQELAYKKRNIVLEPEVRLVGDW
ncbi:MAG: UDP-N-acetylmuramate dehydrogenase [Spirochaetia bacterium]|nr:UDP-N-acetylmuramate dehydrogenase [Spirochaetia bacterium]